MFFLNEIYVLLSNFKVVADFPVYRATWNNLVLTKILLIT